MKNITNLIIISLAIFSLSFAGESSEQSIGEKPASREGIGAIKRTERVSKVTSLRSATATSISTSPTVTVGWPVTSRYTVRVSLRRPTANTASSGTARNTQPTISSN